MGMTKGMQLQTEFAERKADELRGDLQAIAILVNRATRVKDYTTKCHLWNAQNRLSVKVIESVQAHGYLWGEIVQLAAKGTEGL